MIRNIFIIQEGIALVKFNFGECHSLSADGHLIAGFMSGLETFTKEITGSSIHTIDIGDYKFHFLKDNSSFNLLYVFLCENESQKAKIDFKMKKTAELFTEQYEEELKNFYGEISIFQNFKETLLEMNIAKKNCGGRPECVGCPNSSKSLKFLDSFKQKDRGFFQKLKSFFK
jgi:hypothetical protein